MSRQLVITFLIAGLFVSVASAASAQMPPAKPVDPKVIAAINEQVWIPFCESFATNDSEAFLALHTTDAVRVGIDRNDVKSGDAFRESIMQQMKQFKDAGYAFSLTLRFTARTHGDDVAFEKGVYKFASASGDYTGYGQFHVMLRKVDGTWKVALDADQEAGAEAFEAARPLEDVDW